MKRYDAIIMGFGKGGKTLATDLAKRGQSVAVVEQSEKMYGGTCINIGCIPTKTLVHAAKQAKCQASWEEKQAHYSRAIAYKDEVTSLLRDKNYHNLADNPQITVYTGICSFTGADTVEVKMEDKTVGLQATQIFINTGAETVIPAIDGINGNPRVYTSTTIMELTVLPRHLAIVGGGYIGLEFASMYASFGSQVTVLEGASQLMAREDRDIATAAQEVLERKGITFRMNASTQSVMDGSVFYKDSITGKEHSLEADAILLATGRHPNTSGLNLAAAGVKVDERGAIVVNEHLQTTNPNIRAMGDVKGGLQFTYISLDDYRIIREDMFGNGGRTILDREPVSYSVFIDPPLSRIGISEEEATRKGLNVRISKLPVASIPRARTLGETQGLFKAVIDADTKKILGCTLFGPDSSEVINSVAVAMKTGQDYTFLRDFIFTHPSMSEALNDLMNF